MNRSEMPVGTLVITGSPVWSSAVEAQLAAAGWKVQQWTARAGYVTQLVDARAALVLVDGQDDAWEFWTTTPKSTPAARRIPIVVIAAQAERRAAALQRGADDSLSSDELFAGLMERVIAWARLPSAALLDQLACQCEEPLPADGLLALERFNAGEYYAQHDLFEALWMAESGPVRDLYRAVLQVGVAYYQIRRGNGRGAYKMLLRSIQWLDVLPDVCQGIDVAQLRADAHAVRLALERAGLEDLSGFDQALLKGVRFTAR